MADTFAGAGPILSRLSLSLGNALSASWVSSAELSNVPSKGNVSQVSSNVLYDELLETYLNMDHVADDNKLPVAGQVAEQRFTSQYNRAAEMDFGEGAVQGKAE